jgi:hypothetical protein
MKKILFIVLVLFSACKRNDSVCKDVFCTMEVRSVGLVLHNGQAIPPAIDYVETWLKGKLINKDTGSLVGNNWLVTVVSDGNRPQLALNKAETLTVRVYQQGVVTKEIDVAVLLDCCHVNKVSGPDTLLVQ